MQVKLNWATRITILRILLIIPFVICMLNMNDESLSVAAGDILRYVAVIIYLVMAVSDGLDGYLARSRGQITKLGVFLDPVADKLLMTSAALLLASSRASVPNFLLPTTVVVFILGKDVLLVIGFVIVYFITGKIHIRTVFVGKLTTALQFVMVAAILIAPEASRLVSGWVWFLRILWWSAASAAVLATLVYIRDGSRYIEQYEQTDYTDHR